MVKVLKETLIELKKVINKFNSHEIGEYELCDECLKLFNDLKNMGIDL